MGRSIVIRRLVPAAGLLAALLVACAPTAIPVGGSGSAAQRVADLETVTPGVLAVAYRTDDKPASFIDNGEPAGLHVEVMRALAARMGVQVTFVGTDFASAVPNVQNHRYDTTAMSVLVTDERKQVVDFSTPEVYAQSRLVSRKAAPVLTVAATKGKTVAITRGSALIQILQTLSPDVTIKEFPNIAASTTALLAGQVDALFTGTQTSTQLVTDHPEFTLGTDFVNSGLDAFPVAKDHPKLLAAINKALASIMLDGTFTALFHKWYPGEEIPQQLLKDYPGMKP